METGMIDSRTLDKPLGDKPSEFLADALQDLQRAERSKDVTVSMDTWCQGDGKVCSVCLAGSVIIMRDTPSFTKTIKHGLELSPADYDAKTEVKLYAINGFRLGRVSETLSEYNLATKEEIAEFEEKFDARRTIPAYNADNPMDFYLAIHQLVNDLRTVGL